MTLTQQIITIALCVLGTQLTRFVPFLIFNEHRKTPAFVQYLGKVLPGAIFSMLVVYCLRSVSFRRYSYGLPELHRRRHDHLHAADPVCLRLRLPW